MRIMLGSLSGFWGISRGQTFYKNYTRISTIVPSGFRRGSKGFLCGFYMDFHVESRGNQWKSRGFLKGFYMSFYKDAMGEFFKESISFNEIISI